MKRNITLGLFVLTLILLPMTNIQAKIVAPVVDPITYDGIRYEAGNHSVLAWDVKNNKMLWEREIYHVIFFMPGMEKDVQDTLIAQLGVKDNSLHVITDHGRVYVVDLKTGKPVHDFPRTRGFWNWLKGLFNR